MQWIKRTWRGEEKLWKVFWVYGVGLSLVGFFTALAVSIWAATSIGVIGSPSESTWYFGHYMWSAGWWRWASSTSCGRFNPKAIQAASRFLAATLVVK